jgi:DNA-binding cell septation regulator SpoVG
MPWSDSSHPIHDDARLEIERAILAAFDKSEFAW